MSDQAEVLTRIEGKVGRITLNRPRSLHALTTNMCRLMIEALLAWRDDPGVELVLFDHSGERGFCAGGDIRMLAQSGAGDGKLAREFFFTEYRLNDLIFQYPKPTVVFMDGVTMGGGVGLALPCRYRVATERTTFAMPETGIGLFPDVGGGWFLSRMSDHVGLWLALTGARIKAADCDLLGVATDCVASESIPLLIRSIVSKPRALAVMLSAFRVEPRPAPLAEHIDEIRDLFGRESVEAIVAALGGADGGWASEQLKVMSGKSPQTLKVAFRQLQLGAAMPTFADNMAMEYRIGARVVQRHDFLEGVRAVIVDKDNSPRWDPPALAGVTPALLDAIFSPLPSDQEWSPLLETTP